LKILVKDQINRLAFVKKNDWSTNSFDIELIKVVGGNVYNYTGLADVHSLDVCRDYIELDVNLVGATLGGGEYVLTLTNDTNVYIYLCLVKSYETSTGSGIYSNVVTFTDL
jgi:hypothetical protein